MERKIQLADWAVKQIRHRFDLKVPSNLSMVSGDASFRKYFRLNHDRQSWICVDAPPDKEDNPKFVDIACRWKAQGVNVPEVIAYDFQRGFMLLEDFGDNLLWPALHQQNATQESVLSLYKLAIDELCNIQTLAQDTLPSYDAGLLNQEMFLFKDWLCTKHLGMSLDSTEEKMLNDVCLKLLNEALGQPIVVVHRDFHSRNLMLCQENTIDIKIGVIDFQDAVQGPMTYDLVSLLRDCYVRWPAEWVDQLMDYYWEKVTSNYPMMEYPVFKKAFDWMGMQRHMKAAGIFARLHHRDGKSGYLKDIPNTCQYLCEVASNYPEFDLFVTWMKNRFIPMLMQKSEGSE